MWFLSGYTPVTYLMTHPHNQNPITISRICLMPVSVVKHAVLHLAFYTSSYVPHKEP